MSTKFTKMGADFVVILDSAVIAPTDVGRRISQRALVVPPDELNGLQGFGRAFDNTEIAFDIDGAGGLGVADNEDNWGAGPLGYDVPRFANIGATGAGVRIGIADSGVDATHPTFAALRSEGRLISFAAFARDGSKVVQHASDGTIVPDTAATPTNTHWHGTFCAAILVGAPTDGKLRGVAPQAELVVTQVLQQGNVGTVASILAGLSWLADQKCDVVSLSLGWDGMHDQWAEPIQTLIGQGTVVVAAAGNSFGIPGVGPSDSPGNYPLEPSGAAAGLLISVGAIDQQNHVADFSGGEVADWSNVINRMPDGTTTPSVFATLPPRQDPVMVGPGVEVISASPPGGIFREENGTSMATPQVAGLIALVLQALRATRPTSTPREAAETVLRSLVPLQSDEAVNRTGRGKVNIDTLFGNIRNITQ
jgi:subtilisin family serine protease